MDVPARIIKFREQQGYSTNKLAKLAGIGQSTLREIEIGEKQPTIYTIDKICSALGITIAEFFADNAAYELNLEVRQIIGKVKKLTPHKLKVLNDVLDTWVDNELTLLEKPGSYKTHKHQNLKQQNEDEDIDISKIVLVAEAEGREEMRSLSPQLQAIVKDAIKVSRQKRKDENKGSE